MPQGLQIWDASGNLIWGTALRMGRVLGVRTLTAPTAGSVANAAFADGTAFWQLQTIGASTLRQPSISLAGTTLSWSFPGAGWSSEAYRLVFGVY